MLSIAEERIHIALQSNADQLDLGALELMEVPPEIRKLKSLVNLDLHGNKLQRLPPEIGQLKQLKKLDIHNNILKDLPQEISLAKNIKELNISFNRLTMIPMGIGRMKNLEFLDISHNELVAIPSTIRSLSKLQILNASDNNILSVKSGIINLKSLRKLDLSKNKLTRITRIIGHLKSLQLLNISNNQIAVIPPEIRQLKNLQILNISNNQLTFILPEIEYLKDLRHLDISRNNMDIIPSEIGGLINLRKLDVSFNKLRAVTPKISELKSLEELNLNANFLMNFPVEIGKIKSLIKLEINSNELMCLPSEISQLQNLEILDLSSNKLEDLPLSMIHLTQMKDIFLHKNESLHLPKEILGPTLDDVRFSGIEPAKPQDILDYYFRIANAKSPLNEAKLILVGFGAVGKTSLVNRLVHNTFNSSETKTDGIQITQWSILLNKTENIRLNIWDFGGQEIMHSTHQFFLTQRSLYLLVLNGRQGHEDEDAEYWLNLIQSFGANSPVIVVLNKIKEQPFNVNRNYLQQKFENIKAYIETDCKEGIGIDILYQVLEQETDQLEHLRDAFPDSWFSIKDQLASMDINYIGYDQYRQICAAHDETNLDAQDSLAFHLHNLGIALNYREDPRLRDTNVLNPQWVTNGIYTAINAEPLVQKNGELQLSDLAQVLDLKDYPLDRHRFLIELMHKFELCFRFPENDSCYLVPDLLDKQQPAAATGFQPATCLNFQYHYPILPEGLLPRFIVRTHVLSANQHRWRSGVILEFDKNRALVRADKADKRVTISINGPPAGRRRLLAIIRSDFETIHSSFKFVPQAMVPIPDHPAILLPYKKLLAFEANDIQTFTEWLGNQYGDATLELNVQQLLDGVDLEGTRRPARTPDFRRDTCRLFISYAHKDEFLKDELETHLKLLERQSVIQGWSDRDITPGNEWRGEIDDNLETADIILLLITADFLASDYCYDMEMDRAIERHNAGEATVIPVIVAPCNWQSARFSKLQSLPTDGKPVTIWGAEKYNRDLAWTNVAQGIEQVAQQRGALA